MNFYVGGDAWDAGDIANIDKALSAAMYDQDLNNVMVQYFPGPITTTFDGSKTLPGSPPAVMSQGDVEQLVATFFSGGKLTGRDLTTTLFNFMLPPGTVLNTDTAMVLMGFCLAILGSTSSDTLPSTPLVLS